MLIEAMSDRECRAMLARTNLARLACALNDQPYIVPIHVDFYDTFVYGFATLGQKIEWMRQNPLVCLEFDEITTAKEWITVVVFGYYEELPDTPELANSRRVAEQLFQRHPVWWEPAAVPIADSPQRNRILFRILINRMTGRRASHGPTSYRTHRRTRPGTGRFGTRLVAYCIACWDADHMTANRLHADVGPDVSVIRQAPQKLRRFERTEDGISASWVEVPQSLCLPFRQMQSGHLCELRLNQANPVTEIFS